MLRIEHRWIWDWWPADDGERFHAFYLQAPRSLAHPDERHTRAGVGHAVSTDLVRWTPVQDAIAAGPPGAFDDQATWTGSVVRGPDGLWRMFYTGLTMRGGGHLQQVGVATSPDLMTWTKRPGPLLRADRRWYELAGSASGDGTTGDGTTDDETTGDETWRDPYVLADPDGDGWHLLVTARARYGATDRGVVGHATSADLETWQVREPLSAAGAGFGELEVLQAEVVDGMPFLLFSCLTPHLSPERAEQSPTGGIWAVPAPSLLGPYDVSLAQPLTDDSLYSGRLVRDRGGRWNLIAFHNRGPGGFVGDLSDPMPLRVVDDHGRPALRLADPAR